MTTDSPQHILEVGRKILDDVLAPHGFRFREIAAGNSSGGQFAVGEFARDDRRLELHFRWSLGGVAYHIGDATLGHQDYMRVMGVHRTTAYPGFSDDPLDGFRHLASDLAEHCADFLSGIGDEFHRLAAKLARNPDMFKGLP